MPYVERDDNGAVVAVTNLPQGFVQEWWPENDPELLAFHGRLDTLDHRKAAAKRRVDMAAEDARQAFLGDIGAGQVLVYGMKLAEATRFAELFDAAAETADFVDFPLLAAEADARGISVYNMGAHVLRRAHRFTAAAAQIEALRFGAKTLIDQVTVDAHADAVFTLILDELTWPEPAS